MQHRLVTCNKMESAVVLHRLQMLDNMQLTEQLTSHLQAVTRALLLNIILKSQSLLYSR